MPHSQGLLVIPILSRINPITLIDTYLFKVHSNIVLPSTPRLPKGLIPVGLPVKILKALLPSSILATCPAHLNLLDSAVSNILYNLPQFSHSRPIYLVTSSVPST